MGQRCRFLLTVEAVARDQMQRMTDVTLFVAKATQHLLAWRLS
jgi:hypothetical protein